MAGWLEGRMDREIGMDCCTHECVLLHDYFINNILLETVISNRVIALIIEIIQLTQRQTIHHVWL